MTIAAPRAPATTPAERSHCRIIRCIAARLLDAWDLSRPPHWLTGRLPSVTLVVANGHRPHTDAAVFRKRPDCRPHRILTASPALRTSPILPGHNTARSMLLDTHEPDSVAWLGMQTAPNHPANWTVPPSSWSPQ